MKPTDLRNATWAEVQGHLADDLRRVLEAWQRHGPGTTRELSDRSGISLLTFRPRTTDLVDLGLVRLHARAGNEGVYIAATEADYTGPEQPRRTSTPAPQVNTLSARDRILAQIRELSVDEQLSIAGSIRAAAAHAPRHTVAPDQTELSLA